MAVSMAVWAFQSEFQVFRCDSSSSKCLDSHLDLLRQEYIYDKSGF